MNILFDPINQIKSPGGSSPLKVISIHTDARLENTDNKPCQYNAQQSTL